VPLVKRYTLLVDGRHAADCAPLASLALPLSFRRGGRPYSADAASRVAHIRCFQDSRLGEEGAVDRIDRDDEGEKEDKNDALGELHA